MELGASATACPGVTRSRVALCRLLPFLHSALDLAKTHSVHLDTVVAHRQRFLDRIGRKETDAAFIAAASTVKVDWDAIKVRRRSACCCQTTSFPFFAV